MSNFFREVFFFSFLCVQRGSQRSVSDVFLYCPLHFPDQGPSRSLELADIMLEWLTTKLQYLTLSTVPGFLHGCWDLNSGLVLAWQAFYQLSPLPSPNPLFYTSKAQSAKVPWFQRCMPRVRPNEWPRVFQNGNFNAGKKMAWRETENKIPCPPLRECESQVSFFHLSHRDEF